MKLDDLFEGDKLVKQETTPLYAQPHNRQGGDGFVTIGSRNLIQPVGAKKIVKAGTKVYITKPGTIYQGVQLNQPAGQYVLIGLHSPQPRSAVGFMALSNIANPQNTQTRVSKGAEAQETFVVRLAAHFGSKFTVISTSPTSSQAPDLIAKFGNRKIQFEVKGRASHTAPITFFDKSIRRGGSDQMLNDVASAFSNGQYNTFEEMIDGYRQTNPQVGFPGDEGTPKSGKLPPEFRVRDNPVLQQQVRDHLIAHFQLSNDNYFAAINRNTGRAEVYWTGVGINPLQAPEFPAVTFVVLDTYGGAYNGAMRVALKVELDPNSIGIEI